MTIRDITRLIVLLRIRQSGTGYSAEKRGRVLSFLTGSFGLTGKDQWSVKKDKIGVITLVMLLVFSQPMSGYAMEAPGDGEAGWYYDQKGHHWYYREGDQDIHRGWLFYNGEWYWFSQDGWMAEGGTRSVDGLSYYFFINGHMAWNQYVGMYFYGEDGQRQKEHDVRIIGTKSPEGEDRDLFSDYLYQIPRSWIARFLKDGWQFMFYKQKKFFAAPDTSMGIYYVYHSVDTHYKKVKFTDVDSVLQAFGEYVGYTAGCYKEGNEWMEILWQEQQALLPVLELPDYYVNDARFYFGKVFAAYLDSEGHKEMIKASPKACEVLEEILHMEDDEKTRERLREKARAEREAWEKRRERIDVPENYGPGVKREEEENISK